MRLIISPKAEKQFKKLPKTTQIIIGRKIRKLLQGEGVQQEQLAGYKKVYKARAGNYRFVYKRFTGKIVVFLFGHRKEVYKLLDRLLGF